MRPPAGQSPRPARPTCPAGRSLLSTRIGVVPKSPCPCSSPAIPDAGQSAIADHRQIDQRPVWLVSYTGMGFSGPPQCECSIMSAQPDTSVALDAATGQLVVSFGTPTDLWSGDSPRLSP